jgi:hypothetical protein
MPAGIKQIKAGPPYKPSNERQNRDTIKCFMNRPDLVEQQIEKLYKVLTPADPSQGYPKSDVIEFMAYLQK